MTTYITATRYHDISAGHRVPGHEGKCKHLHGHGYRIHFTCVAPALDDLGRVIDFGVIKTRLCEWLEREWDHKLILWKDDPILKPLLDTGEEIIAASIRQVGWIPTAENLAAHLLNVIGPQELKGTGVRLIKVVVEETRKCSATAQPL